METAVSKALRFARKHLDLMGFSDMELPIIRVVTRTGAKWAGLHVFNPTSRDSVTGEVRGFSEIFIQYWVVDGGDLSLERIVAHEVIHYALYETHGYRVANRIKHGPKFMALRAVINGVMGDDFVQVECTKDFDKGAMRKAVNLVLYRKEGMRGPAVAWFVRETPSVRRTLMRLSFKSGIELRVAASRDVRWTSFPRLATCNFGVPSEELAVDACKLWDGGVPVRIRP